MSTYIPEKFYVARFGKSADEVLGFMVPITKSSSNMIATANKWAGANALPPIEVDNTPQSGYSLVTFSRRYSTSNVVWRIQHPLGFEIEISSENMMEILGGTTIINGAIQEELQWIRKGRLNEVYPKNSPKLVIAITQIQVEETVNIKDVKPGNLVVGANGTEMYYLGGYHIIGNDFIEHCNIKLVKSKKVHVFMNTTTLKGATLTEDMVKNASRYDGYGSLKLRKIKDTAVLDSSVITNALKANINKLRLFSSGQTVALDIKPFDTTNLKPYKVPGNQGSISSYYSDSITVLQSGEVLIRCSNNYKSVSKFVGTSSQLSTLNGEDFYIHSGKTNRGNFVWSDKPFNPSDIKEVFSYQYDVIRKTKGGTK